MLDKYIVINPSGFNIFDDVDDAKASVDLDNDPYRVGQTFVVCKVMSVGKKVSLEWEDRDCSNEKNFVDIEIGRDYTRRNGSVAKKLQRTGNGKYYCANGKTYHSNGDRGASNSGYDLMELLPVELEE